MLFLLVILFILIKSFQNNCIFDYGCDVNPQKVKGVSIGGNIFGINDDIPATIGLGPCVGLVAFSDAFTFLAHIDMGNYVGFNFDANGKCIHLEKLYKRILRLSKDLTPLGSAPQQSGD